MCKLLSLLHARGPNINNLKSTNTKGGDDAIGKIRKIIEKYSIVAKASGSSSAITLPRLSQTFPALSMDIWVKLYDSSPLNKPVTETEINLLGFLSCSPNCVPSLLKDISTEHCQMVFFIYCLYQGALSCKTQVPTRTRAQTGITTKTKEEHFSDASRYAQLSYEGSYATGLQKTGYDRYFSNVVSEITKESLLQCMKLYFTNISKIDLPVPQTKYHYLLAYYKSKGQEIDQMMAGDLSMSFDEIKRSYRIEC